MGTVRLSRGDRTYRSRAATVIVVAGCLWAAAASLWSGVASAQMPEKVYTRADYTDWLTKYANAKPDFKAGDVLTAKDIERMRPFVIPGYLDYLNFPNFKMRIVAPIDHTPLGKFQDCTEKYQPQVKLKPGRFRACNNSLADLRYLFSCFLLFFRTFRLLAFSYQIDESRSHTQTPYLDFCIGLTQSCHDPFSIQRADSDALAEGQWTIDDRR